MTTPDPYLTPDGRWQTSRGILEGWVRGYDYIPPPRGYVPPERLCAGWEPVYSSPPDLNAIYSAVYAHAYEIPTGPGALYSPTAAMLAEFEEDRLS